KKAPARRQEERGKSTRPAFWTADGGRSSGSVDRDRSCVVDALEVHLGHVSVGIDVGHDGQLLVDDRERLGAGGSARGLRIDDQTAVFPARVDFSRAARAVLGDEAAVGVEDPLAPSVRQDDAIASLLDGQRSERLLEVYLSVAALLLGVGRRVLRRRFTAL